MHRASVFEAVGNFEASKKDLAKILEADPKFVQKYHAQAAELEQAGHVDQANKINEFLMKMLS